MHKHFEHGVARGPKAAARQVPTAMGYPPTASGPADLYWANYKHLDVDKDGTACEA